MQKGKERVYKSKGLTLYHQNFPKKQLKAHSHKEAHLFIPLMGGVELEVEGILYKLAAGQMMFIGADVEHSFLATGESGERIILQIEKFSFKSNVAILPVNQLIKDLCLNIFSHASESYASAIEKLLTDVLKTDLVKERKSDNRLFDTQQRILSSQNNQLIKVVNVMENNLEIKLAEIASKCGLSPRSLTRLTNEETGLSPNELHTFYRIKKASELIYLGELSLTGVAFECGYNSLSQFIENFKRWTGSKPSQHVSAV